MRRISSSLLGAALGLMLAPGFCGAEPIRWQYYVTTTGGGVGINGFGHIDIHVPDREATESIIREGSQRFLDYVTYGGRPGSARATLWINESAIPFQATVHLRDLASGQRGEVSFAGMFHYRGDEFGGPILPVLTTPRLQKVRIGGTLYAVEQAFRSQGGMVTDHISPDFEYHDGASAIHVRAGIEAMPEPGTLTLAGIGLAGCGLAAWRNKRRTRRG